jgi:hypothetical protein
MRPNVLKASQSQSFENSRGLIKTMLYRQEAARVQMG